MPRLLIVEDDDRIRLSLRLALEDEGYTVNLQMADVAPVYSGLTTDDYDVVLDTWLPTTHASYIERYGDDLTDLGAWNDGAKLAVAVNEDAPIDSLDELAANADLFGGTIVGIEPGAGLTAAVQDETIPTYGLSDMQLQTSSTAAMLETFVLISPEMKYFCRNGSTNSCKDLLFFDMSSRMSNAGMNPLSA